MNQLTDWLQHDPQQNLERCMMTHVVPECTSPLEPGLAKAVGNASMSLAAQ